MPSLTEAQRASFLKRFPGAKLDEPMSAHTYLKIGGPAQLFLLTDNPDDLVSAIKAAKELEIPWFVMGGGSNLLVSDDGYKGLIIQSADTTFNVRERTVVASAGALTALVARTAADAGLRGFEWGAGLPGTIGGAIFGNSGCFGGEMRNSVVTVDCYEIATGKRIILPNVECKFGYRDSRFQHEALIILKTVLALKPGGKVEELKKKITEIMSQRQAAQPKGKFSAGCMFKNFDFKTDAELEILKRQVSEIPEDMLKNKRLGAGWLIDQVGLKSTTIGQAQVSENHANFIVNLGGARAQDILQLTSLVKMKVRDELGILLEDEVRLVGF
ncbi:MAG: UDP-N-acetylmuramate dehydrogenase [Patescibacteria group bacterium]